MAAHRNARTNSRFGVPELRCISRMEPAGILRKTAVSMHEVDDGMLELRAP